MTLLLMFGIAIARGLFDDLTWVGVATAVLLVVVVPAASPAGCP